jgi:hypothetical protein
VQQSSGAGEALAPQSRDFRGPDKPDSPRQSRKQKLGWSQNLNDQVGDLLNPVWVSVLMGFPSDW